MRFRGNDVCDYTGRTVYRISGSDITDYTGRIIYRIDGYLSSSELAAIIAII